MQTQKPKGNYRSVHLYPLYYRIQIPVDWEESNFEDVLEIRKGISYKSDEINDRGVGNLLINLNCFEKFGGFNKDGIKYYTGKFEPKSILKEQDVVIANTDVTRQGEVVGYPIEIPTFDPGRIVIHSLDTSKIVIKNKISKSFLYYFLSTSISHNCMKAFSAGTTVLHLDLDSVKRMKILIPSVIEQQRIASILREVDELIEKTDQVIGQIQTLKKGLMQKLLTKGIGHTKFKDIHLGLRFLRLSIPENWNIANLDEITEIIDTPHYTSPYIDSGIPVVRTADCDPSGQINYSNTKFTSENEYEKRRETIDPNVGDVLYTREAPPGIAVLVDRKKISIGQRIVLVKPNAQIINGEFLVSFLNSRFCMLQSNAMILKTTVEHVNIEDIKKFRLAIPPIEEQKLILGIIKKINYYVSVLKSSRDHTSNIKRGLMQKLLTGKIRVKV